MAIDSKILVSIPSDIDVSQSWNVCYWSNQLGVSGERLKHVVSIVGPNPERVQRHLNEGVRIAIRDDTGILRLAVRLTTENGGFGVSVPYHPSKIGWVIEHPVRYDTREGVVPVGEMTQYVVEDSVKLSIHMNGFVQFSSATNNRIVSGFNQALQKPKGVGLHINHPIEVYSGPLFGVILQGLDQFRTLSTELAEVFEDEDRWHHPSFSGPEDRSLHVEFFMLPLTHVASVRATNGKRNLRRRLPFCGQFKFDHELRIIELPHLHVALGAIISRVASDKTIESGYKIAGPSLLNQQGKHVTIAAWYPRPDFVDPSIPSLMYRGTDHRLGVG